MKNKILVVLIFSMFLFSLSSVLALDNQGTGQQNQNFTIVQACNDANFITLSTIQLPDRTLLIIDQNMTLVASGTYNYNFTNTSQLGRYDVTGVSDGCENTFALFITITPSGLDLDTSQSIIVLGLILILILLTVSFIYFGNKTEYIPMKIFLVSLSILFIMLTVGVSLNAVKQLMIMGAIFSGIFVNLYRLMLILVSAGGIGLIVYIIYMSIKQFQSMRGLIDQYDD